MCLETEGEMFSNQRVNPKIRTKKMPLSSKHTRREQRRAEPSRTESRRQCSMRWFKHHRLLLYCWLNSWFEHAVLVLVGGNARSLDSRILFCYSLNLLHSQSFFEIHYAHVYIRLLACALRHSLSFGVYSNLRSTSESHFALILFSIHTHEFIEFAYTRTSHSRASTLGSALETHLKCIFLVSVERASHYLHV